MTYLRPYKRLVYEIFGVGPIIWIKVNIFRITINKPEDDICPLVQYFKFIELVLDLKQLDVNYITRTMGMCYIICVKSCKNMYFKLGDLEIDCSWAPNTVTFGIVNVGYKVHWTNFIHSKRLYYSWTFERKNVNTRVIVVSWNE